MSPLRICLSRLILANSAVFVAGAFDTPCNAVCLKSPQVIFDPGAIAPDGKLVSLRRAALSSLSPVRRIYIVVVIGVLFIFFTRFIIPVIRMVLIVKMLTVMNVFRLSRAPRGNGI
ncbi:unnamed protein product [Protopolystoma xenopodis]|uniref:Uncharacterized protein n=1 Tax=Protopolystoma xenopodis TaxID=117903 RepID=A0A448XKE7_9PLAT|nr:unnamed protein product [Protopolystoma xenopodis]